MDLQRAWLERGALARLLWPLSLLFAVLAALRRGLYRAGLLRSERVPVPVLVVGNVVAGGAGKTPSVIAIVRHLQARRVPVGVISRGYGRATDDCREVLANSAPHEAGDEPLLIQRATSAPTFVGQRRIEAARALLERHPQTRLIVSDDGLQHLALARDLEICVFDARATGNGWLLPAGPLREPWPRPVDLVLRPREASRIAGFELRRALAASAVRADGERTPLAALRDRPLHALAGIASPEAFFAMLRARGLSLAATTALPDHHDFGDAAALAPAATLVCTEKDAVKLWRLRPDAWAVPLALEIEPSFWSAFDRLLDARLSSPHGSPTA